ncbi:exportin T (tRNA exportin)-like protein [Leishmania infantum JPCM5]|uniref:Exportin-T n=2 Tax=Leishmania infantum TaxID=5671 RepID=A0A6L0WGZ1_LEIIN|nr:exportin T (tRNA exportin)-like protein [Leishmania infantum JPCM5]CAC9437824.1 tRNA_exportin_-_putative [Leishmania infantum]CAM65245.1 exportin T (tRNA exportin)-like protein [Leishmania infantum JPCM5]SUZ38635.1 tRNA_exportin_-_putative [Leishmania infantum]|eukprot:XP_001462706.1 exportin T (tRNA exportin)-like protein [Leishmania infantum JPCM5]
MPRTENFTEALQLTHNFDASVSHSARLEAERYLMDLRESAEGLKLSFHIISNEAVDELRCFWAFNTVMHHLPMLAATVDAEQAQEFYHTLLSFIHRYLFASPTVTPIDYVVNKHAQMMVVGLQLFYPARWQSIFDDLFEMLDRRPTSPYLPTADLVTIYVLRIFEYIDERVVCVRDRQERGKQQQARDMELKDAMRERVLPKAADMWYNILLSDARARNPDMARLCLSVMQTYIEWADVNLFMTENWIHLLHFLLTVPPLQVAACECLLSLVEKKQLPGIKMRSLRALSVVDSVPRMMSLFELPPPSEAAVLFMEAAAKFAVAVAGQFLSLLDTCASLAQQQPATRSAATVEVSGVVLRDEPFTVTADLLDGLAGALHAVVGQVILVLQLNLFDVHDALLPFLQVYLKSAYLLESEAVELLATLFHQTRIPGVAYDENRIWDDTVIDQRKTLHNLLRLLHRRRPDLVMSHLHSLLLTGLSRLSEGGGAARASTAKDDADFTDPEVLEAALRYLYEIGESLRLENLKDPNDTITQLLQRVLTTEAVVSGEATCVHLAFFEVLGRYYLFFTYRPEFIPLLLQRLLLQPCGVMSRSDRVRARICYLFGYLLQLLKSQLGAYAADMVNALHSIVTTAPQLQPGDRRELYEAIGILLSICSEEASPALDGSSSEALRLLTASASMDDYGAAVVTSAVLAEVAPLLGRKAELVHTVVGSALHSLQQASASCAGMNGGAAGGSGHAAARSVAAAERAVADVISFLSALAKGLGSTESSSGAGSAAGSGASNGLASSPNGSVPGQWRMGTNPNASGVAVDGPLAACGAPSDAPLSTSSAMSATGLLVAQMFLHVTQRVMEVANQMAGSAVLRDAVGQFFHQLINTLPYEMLRPYIEDYVTVCLNWMEAVPELSKLLRLMFQYANKAGNRGVLSVARLTSLLWHRLCAVGELSEASPVVCMGVVSESARERVNVYKQFFTFLFSVSTWGCVAAFALMPSACWMSILRQLCYALTLPTELELPKSALQVLEKLTQELTDPVVAQAVAQYSSATDVVDAATAQRNQQVFSECLLQEALPTAFGALADPSFDLDDAKNFLLLGEVLQLFRVLVARYGEPAMQVLYERVAPYVGEATAMECCTVIRDQPRVNAALKVKMKQLLSRVHESQRRTPANPLT